MALRKIYLLDTNILSEMTKVHPDEKVMVELERQSKFCAISAQTWYELQNGLEIMQEGKKKERVLYIVNNFVRESFPIIAYDENAAALNAAIYGKLRSLGKITPVIDTQIASVAMANNMILVTRNVKDYEAIADNFSLCIENWFD